MSKSKLREDKTCLNCGTTVEERFCPQCGQENTETRKSFHYLFTHFLEDLIHYDSGFWKTMKYLLFRPARLTREYLSGKRMAYVAPVKLYIFISFITFFLSGFFMGNPMDLKATNKNNEAITNTDTLSAFFNKRQSGLFTEYKTVHELDSVQATLPADKKLNPVNYWFAKKITKVNEHNTPNQILSKFFVSFKQNLPKVLFLFMPVFAFWLWIFHGKKRWYYFDHGIFTLHYFSFLLLSTGLLMIIDASMDYLGSKFFLVIKGITIAVYFLWSIFYFYKAHKRMYGESKFVSFVKGSLLIFINWLFILFFIVLLALYSIISIE
ncbi:DUF3667 domain-containing protein [Flavobacterium pedocola]